MRANTSRRRWLAVGLSLAPLAGPADAAVMTWSVPHGGFFQSGINWDLGSSPGFNDSAVFNHPGGDYTVTFNPVVDASNQWLRVDGGISRFDLNGRTYALTATDAFWPQFQSLQMCVYNSFAWAYFQEGTLEIQHGVIGYTAGGSGLLHFHPTADLISAGRLDVGYFGNGILWLEQSHATLDGLRIAAGAGGSGTISVADGATLACTGASAVEIGAFGDGTLSVFGAGSTFSAGAVKLGVQPGAAGTLEVESGGSAQVSALDVASGSDVLVGAGSTLEVDGLTMMQYSNSRLDLYGTMRTGSLVNEGVFAWYDGSTLEITNDDLHVAPGGPLGEYAYVQERELIISGDLEVHSPGPPGAVAVLDVRGGTVSCAADLIVAQGAAQDGQILVAGTGNAAGEIAVAGSLYLAGNADGSGGIADMVVNPGTFIDVADTIMIWDDGTLTQGHGSEIGALALEIVGGTLDHGGAIIIGDNAQFNDWLSFRAEGDTSASVVVRDGGQLVTHDGAIAYRAGSRGDVTVTGGSTWTITGNLRMGRSDGSSGDGTLTIADGAYVNVSGQAFVNANQTLDLDDGTLIADEVINHASVIGAGLIAADVENHGLIAPGHSPGQITIGETLTMKPGSTLEMQFGGTAPVDHDHVQVNGPVILEGGVLQASLLEGYEPPSGDQVGFIVLAAGGITGTLDGVEPAHRFELVYGPQEVVVFLRPSCTGDVDASGHVGFDDLAILLGSWGPCAGDCPDLDDSGHVGFDDLALLLGSWGECA